MPAYRAVIDAHCKAGDWASALRFLEDARRDRLKPTTGDLRMMVEVRGAVFGTAPITKLQSGSREWQLLFRIAVVSTCKAFASLHLYEASIKRVSG